MNIIQAIQKLWREVVSLRREVGRMARRGISVPPERTEKIHVIKIDELGSTSGCYRGLLMVRNATSFTPDGGGNLNVATYFDETENVVSVRNAAEHGAAGHQLEVGDYIIGFLNGVDAEGLMAFDTLASVGGGDTLPVPTALYQVLSVTAYVDSTDYTIEWDWVRAH